MRLETRNYIELYSKEEDFKIIYSFKKEGHSMLGNRNPDNDGFIVEVEPHKNSSGYKTFKFRTDLAKDIRAYKKIGFTDITKPAL